LSREELISFLKEHLSLKITTNDFTGYGSDKSYTEYTISLELDGERIGNSETISVPV